MALRLKAFDFDQPKLGNKFLHFKNSRLLIGIKIFSVCAALNSLSADSTELQNRNNYYSSFFTQYFALRKSHVSKIEYRLATADFDRKHAGKSLVSYLADLLADKNNLVTGEYLTKKESNDSLKTLFLIYKIENTDWLVPLLPVSDFTWIQYFVLNTSNKTLEKWEYRQYQLFGEFAFLHFRNWQGSFNVNQIILQDVVIGSEIRPSRNHVNLLWDNPVNVSPNITYEISYDRNRINILKKKRGLFLYGIQIDSSKNSCLILDKHAKRVPIDEEYSLLDQVGHDYVAIQSLEWHEHLGTYSTICGDKLQELTRKKRQAMPVCTPETPENIRLNGDCRM